MKTLLFTSICIIGFSCFASLRAQPGFGGWLATFNTVKTGKKTSIHSDFQLRSTDDIRQVQTLLLRAGLNYHMHANLTLTAGYAFIPNRREIGTTSGYLAEHRIWEQLIIGHKLNSMAVSHRFRLEQRFIPTATVISNQLEKDGSVYANRLRYFIRNILPLKKGGKTSSYFFAALQNEVFLNIGNTSPVNGALFDQNRFYIAVGRRLSTKADLEIGYMNQYVDGRGTQFTNNHILQLAGYFRL